MRVIAGSARGRKLQVPAGRGTRPTPARVREALFSMLASHLELPGAAVLDLFAGSGALGIEALSRGAAQATFVEVAATAQRALRHNLQPFGGRARLLAQPAAAALRLLPPARFDLVLLDPPFALQLLPATVAALGQNGLLRPAAVVVCEHASRQPPALPAAASVLCSRRFGEVSLILLQWPALSPPAAEEPPC